MKILLYLGLLAWFLGWLYVWIVVWAGFDIWRWFRKKPKHGPGRGITIAELTDPQKAKRTEMQEFLQTKYSLCEKLYKEKERR